MGLSVQKFFNIRPKLPFRFKVDIYAGFGKNQSLLSYCVTSVNLPKLEGQAGEGTMYLGNTIYTVPVWKPASRKIEITFEETDKMLVSRFLDFLNAKSYGRKPWRLTIVIHQFEEHMRYSQTKAYVCHLSSYEEPQFKRDGAAAQVTLNATFIVDTIIDNWDSSKIITGYSKNKENKEYNPNLDTLTVSNSDEEFSFKNFDVKGASNLKTGKGISFETETLSNGIKVVDLISSGKAHKGFNSKGGAVDKKAAKVTLVIHKTGFVTNGKYGETGAAAG